jgi:hypothetical protein
MIPPTNILCWGQDEYDEQKIIENKSTLFLGDPLSTPRETRQKIRYHLLLEEIVDFNEIVDLKRVYDYVSN